MSRSGKNKAVKHQNEIRDLIRLIFCPPFHEDDVLSRPMGQSGSDIILTPAIRNVVPFSIECKRHEDKTWKGTYKKSFEQAFNCDYIPLLVRRKNRSGNHYFSRLDDILNIHPLLMKDCKLIAHDNLKTFSCSTKTCIMIYNNYVHFNDKKFLEVLTCLKKSYSQ